MDLFFKIVLFFWIIVSVKQVLFWIYLWQLKEYHIPRFIDHFRTAKGKQIIWSKLRILKIVLLLLISSQTYLFWILFFVYTVEFLFFIKQLLAKNIKKPKFTKKSILLIFICFVFCFLILIINNSLNNLLLIDIILPIIVSGIVLSFEPIVIIIRKRIIKEAKEIINQRKDLVVIGITGSYGKTTTKEFLTTILSTKYNVLSTKEHKNSEMGIAETILNDLKLEHKILIVEMGAYRKGGIKLLCDIVKPKIGIITGVNLQHLSLFNSIDNLLSAEGGKELTQALPKNGFIAINGENRYCVNLYKNLSNSWQSGINKLIYTETGDKIDSDIFAKNIELSKNKISFFAINKNKQAMHFDVNVLGKHNLQNILGAVLVANKLGMSLDEISQAVKNIKPEQAGIVVKKGVYGINIIDSSYSSNPDGVIADLETLKLFEGKKVVVMPCLIELGNRSKEEHFKIGRKIGEICDLAIIITKDKFSEIKKGFEEEIIKEYHFVKTSQEKKILFLENTKEIFHKITTFCKEGDVVLLEGRVPEKLIKLLNEK